jgi:hypothetical protein
MQEVERKEMAGLEAQQLAVRAEIADIVALLKRKEAEDAELTRRLAQVPLSLSLTLSLPQPRPRLPV